MRQTLLCSFAVLSTLSLTPLALAGGTSTHVQTFNIDGEFGFSAGTLAGSGSVLGPSGPAPA